MSDKTFAELEAQANAMIIALTTQRNAASDQVVQLLGENAILTARLHVAQLAIDTSKVEQAAPAEAST